MDDSRSEMEYPIAQLPDPGRDVVLVGRSRWPGGRGVERRDGASTWLVIHTVDGSARIREGEATAIVRSGDVAALVAGTPHSYVAEDDGWDFSWAHVTTSIQLVSLLRPLRDATVGDGILRASPHEHEASINEAFERALRDATDPLSDGADESEDIFRVAPIRRELLVRHAVEEVLLRAFGDETRSHPVDRLLAVVTADLSQQYDVATLARLAGYSPSHVTRMFRERTGLPPVKALTKLRIDTAVTLLTLTDLDVQRVGACVGFADPFYFSRVFRSVVGSSPSDYRKRRGITVD